MNPSYQKDIGLVLQNAREEAGLTLLEASAALHIRAHYLHALEIGELVVLPGAAYTKGYLLAYTSFLRLDKDEILRRFERIETDLPERGLFFPHVFSSEKKPSNSAVWGGVLLALLVYAIWFISFRPQVGGISIVETPPDRALIFREYSIPGSVFNLPCVSLRVTLYPACYRADIDDMVGGYLLPLNHNIVSIMELSK